MAILQLSRLLAHRPSPEYRAKIQMSYEPRAVSLVLLLVDEVDLEIPQECGHKFVSVTESACPFHQ